MTLAELAPAARPAILIPLPIAADDRQNKNASHFAKAGAAVVLDPKATAGAQLAQLLGEVSADSARRQTMAAAMRTLARPQAAQDIVDRRDRLAARR